jgi:DNA repair protein RecO (recombination protein O)
MRSYKTEGIVINRRNFLEKDRILTLFTKERGKIEARAFGARRPGSKLSYISDLGIIAKFSISGGKSLDIITEAQVISLPERIRGDFNGSRKLSHAFKYANELFELDDPHPKTFELLRDLTNCISREDKPILFLSFILNIISDLGLEPELFGCTFCNKPFTDKCVLGFSPKEGLVHINCYKEELFRCDVNDIKIMRAILNYNLKQIVVLKVGKKKLRKVYELIKPYFAWHFGKRLPEELI